MDAAFTVAAYSVQQEPDQGRRASITLTDPDNRWRARVDFVADPDDTARSHVEMCDESCGLVLMAADYLEHFVELLRSDAPLYVSFSTDEDLFFVTASTYEDAIAA